MKRLLCAILTMILLLALLIPAAFADQDKIRSSCVRVWAEDDQNAWIGTAFAVGKVNAPVRYFVTNAHVASGASSIYIIFDNASNMVPCNVVVISDRCDLAVLMLDSNTNIDRTPAVLRPFDAKTELGNKTEEIWAYGYPAFAVEMKAPSTGDKLRADTRNLIVTNGTISGIFDHATTREGENIMHTADLSGGNSGGPLVDKDGYVLGVNASRVYESSENNMSSSSYAVSINEVIRLLETEKIPFTTNKDIRKKWTMLIVLIAAGIAVAGTVVAILLTRNKGNKASTSNRNAGSGRRILVCDSGALLGHAPFELKAKTTIGRQKSHTDIAFPDDTRGVSGLHCTVLFENGQVKVRDENSSYGTWIDNTKLQPGVPTVMHRGQRLYLGSKKESFLLRS